MERLRARSPSPYSIRAADCSYPEVAAAACIDSYRSSSRTAFVAVAFRPAMANDSQGPFEVDVRGHPNRAFAIFDEAADGPIVQQVVAGELPVLPACEPAHHADPE